MFGFVVGIVFWHLIGFWTFVYQVVLPPVPARGGAAAAGATSGAVAEPVNTRQHFLPARAARPRLGKPSSVVADRHDDPWSVTVTDDQPETKAMVRATE